MLKLPGFLSAIVVMSMTTAVVTGTVCLTAVHFANSENQFMLEVELRPNQVSIRAVVGCISWKNK